MAVQQRLWLDISMPCRPCAQPGNDAFAQHIIFYNALRDLTSAPLSRLNPSALQLTVESCVDAHVALLPVSLLINTQRLLHRSTARHRPRMQACTACLVMHNSGGCAHSHTDDSLDAR